jgi:hypothetical protein
LSFSQPRFAFPFYNFLSRSLMRRRTFVFRLNGGYVQSL